MILVYNKDVVDDNDAAWRPHIDPLAWDVTAVSTLADSYTYLHASSNSAGGAAEIAPVSISSRNIPSLLQTASFNQSQSRSFEY